MPLYEQMVVIVPKLEEQLVRIFKSHATTILKNGGTVRAIENHGIRPLPERAVKYAFFHNFRSNHMGLIKILMNNFLILGNTHLRMDVDTFGTLVMCL